MFYSQKLAVKTQENTCARCTRKFAVWNEYHSHTMAVPQCTKKFIPVNISGRSKQQIVTDVESTTLKEHIL